MNLIAACVTSPVKVAVGVILVTLFGVLAILSMPVQLTPEVQIPTVTVDVSWRGASPQEIERELVQALEEQLRTVEGLVKLSSSSGYGEASIDLEFPVGTDMPEALVKVNTRLQQIRKWPIDADRPSIRTTGANDRPVAWLILSQGAPDAGPIRKAQAEHPALAADLGRVLSARTPDLALYRLRKLAASHPEIAGLVPPELDIEAMRRMAEDEIESRLERVRGVSNADLIGGRADELQVIVDPQLLAARGLTIDDLRTALANQNQDTSGGDLWEGKRRYLIRTLGQFRSPEQVAGVIIARRDGKPVYVRDVARVELGKKKPEGLVRRFGARTIAIRVTREKNANVLETMQRLRAVAADIDVQLARQGLGLKLVYDETTYIDSAIGLVNDNIFVGGLLTLGTLLLFLRNVRSTLIVALSIPVSVMGTFLALAACGRSLNVISLAGIAFAVGMLIDNSVVVLENIFVRWQAGEDPRTAAIRGTQEVWGAILASTLTNVAVFLPVLFVRGEAGQLFGDIAVAISAAVGLSLAVAGLVVPTAAALLLRGKGASDAAAVVAADAASGRPSGDLLGRLGGRFVDGVVGINRFLMARTLRAGLASVAIFACGVVATWLLLPKVEYLPEGNRNLVFGIMLPPPGYNIDEMLDLGTIAGDRLLPYWDVDPGTPEAAALDGPILADAFFVLSRGRSIFVGARALDPLAAAQVVPVIRRATAGLPGTFTVVKQSSLFEQGLGSGRTVDVEITGPDLPRLVRLGQKVMAGMPEAVPGGQALPKPSLDLSSPEVQLVPLSEQAADMQLDARQLGYMVDCLVDGGYATDYFLDNDRIDLVIKGDDRFVQRTQDLRNLPVVTPGGQLVPLASVAEVREFSSGPEQILHRERERAITVQVSPPTKMPLEEAQDRIQRLVIDPLEAAGDLAGGYRITLGGTTDKLRSTWRSLWFNLLIAGVITYLLMAALFESWIHPAVIIASLPLGSVGGLLGVGLLNWIGAAYGIYQPLDVLTMLGFVILVGTVVNNPILIVERALQLARAGEEPVAATLEAVRSRIRPIFMTTFTTVLGLLPLVIFPGAGSELYRGLGAVILGGILFSTVITLVQVPLLLVLSFRLFDPRDQAAPAASIPVG
jgi:HAE1 family hydrophobic/amphiphilic exporter-1